MKQVSSVNARAAQVERQVTGGRLIWNRTSLKVLGNLLQVKTFLFAGNFKYSKTRQYYWSTGLRARCSENYQAFIGSTSFYAFLKSKKAKHWGHNKPRPNQVLESRSIFLKCESSVIRVFLPRLLSAVEVWKAFGFGDRQMLLPVFSALHASHAWLSFSFASLTLAVTD